MIYGYVCKCGSAIQIERSIHEEVIAPTCYDCHETMARVWDTPPITLKPPPDTSGGLLIAGDGKGGKSSTLLVLV